jgi:hypothetical protein
MATSASQHGDEQGAMFASLDIQASTSLAISTYTRLLRRCSVAIGLKETTLAGVLVVSFACSGATPEPHSAETEQSAGSSETALEGGPIGTKVIRDVNESDQVYEIGPNQGAGLGSYAVRLDGKPVWPPQGAGCDKLISCCTDLTKLGDAMALSCLLATARDGNCDVALNTASAIAVEQGHTLPAACAR